VFCNKPGLVYSVRVIFSPALRHPPSSFTVIVNICGLSQGRTLRVTGAAFYYEDLSKLCTVMKKTNKKNTKRQNKK
jgi:alpha-D-ribose 1-methylphosphonate 5-triphosphate synthase subunit PhnH